MWIFPEEISEIAYEICFEKDVSEVRDLITSSYWAYNYCKNIKDRPEMRNLITKSRHAYLYCRDVKDRPEMRNRITGSYWAYRYCKDVKNRPEIRKRINKEPFNGAIKCGSFQKKCLK